MTSTRYVKAAALAASVGVVAALGVSSSTATTAGPGDRDASGDRAGVRVILPGAPGERADVVSGGSDRARGIAARSARAERANMADKMFVHHMIPHHYQAILMSRMAPTRAADKRVKGMAERIRSEQNVEIDSMQGWQGRVGEPVTNAEHAYHHMLQDPEMVEHMGMATAGEMAKLKKARGRAFDKLLLKLMIPHHRGAIRMAEDVAGSGNDLFVRQVAIDMISSQSRQVHDMRQIRKSW